LASAKRIDNIVKAFLKMPDKKILIVYWENDPQKEEIFKLANKAKNIEFKTFTWNIGFTEAVWNSIAWICIPIDEDFWMVPVELMAAWKPVLWVNEWWLKESIIHKETWYLIKEWGNPNDIIKAIKYLSPKKCLEMRKSCEKRAENFSYEKFKNQINNYINS